MVSDGADSTRGRLLAAAEKILVEQGVNALSVRRVGDAAGLNPTLVTYHFKGILNLLDELATLNLQPMLADWAVIQPGAASDARTVLNQWLQPMLRPSAFTPGGRALSVLDEVAAHGESALRDRVIGVMGDFSLRLRQTLAPFLPHLSDGELRARVRFISGSALGPPPRSYTVAPREGDWRLDDMHYLLPFACAALGVE